MFIRLSFSLAGVHTNYYVIIYNLPSHMSIKLTSSVQRVFPIKVSMRTQLKTQL